MFDFSPVQIILVLVIALLVFGAKRMPEMGRNLGRGMREFKSSISGDEPTSSAFDLAGPPPDRVAGAPAVTAEAARPETSGASTAVDAERQTVPAPTPEIAEAEIVDAEAKRAKSGPPRASRTAGSS